ncbi:MAG: LamG-like jellyroll fold domain-containing protein [Candidatus Heimdallarchaeota archaeon]
MAWKQFELHLFGLCLLLVLSGVALASFSTLEVQGAVSEAKGLVLHLPMDEGTGSTVYDHSGNHNDGMIYGARWTAGISGRALVFDGVDDYVSLSKSLVDMTELTIECWVYYTSGSNIGTILSDATPVDHNDLVFEMSSTSIGIRADKSGASLRDWYGVFSQNTPAITGLSLGDSWHHVAWTMTSSESKIYVDFVLKTTKVESGSNVGYHARNPSIGRWDDEGRHMSMRYFHGIIDEFRIYNRALSEIEIQTHYNQMLGGDVWHPCAPMPTPRADLAVAVVNERIYAIGGFNGIQNLATMEEYNPATDTWRSRAPMPTARGWLAATAVNGKIYVLGGWDGTNYLPTVEEYDPTTDTWRRRAPMPTHRYGLAMAAVGGRIFAIGGQNEIAEGYQ